MKVGNIIRRDIHDIHYDTSKTLGFAQASVTMTAKVISKDCYFENRYLVECVDGHGTAKNVSGIYGVNQPQVIKPGVCFTITSKAWYVTIGRVKPESTYSNVRSTPPFVESTCMRILSLCSP
jgi:hypothetical protein